MKTYKRTTMLWIILVVLSMQTHGALFAFMSAPFTFIFLIVCIFNLIIKKKPPKEIGIKLLIITVSYLVIAAVHVVRFQDARKHAEFVLTRIQAFHTTHGQYPANSREVGITDEDLRKQRLFYDNQQGNPILFYPATQMPFDTYSFNFKKSKWEYRSG